MSDVCHRTTLEIRRSVNEPDYPMQDWLHFASQAESNAALAIPQHYRKLQGETVVEMSQAERDAVDADRAAAATSSDRTRAKSVLDNRELVAVIDYFRKWNNETVRGTRSLQTVLDGIDAEVDVR